MFRLVKHYFDGIDDSGNAIILYVAALNFWGIKIPFSSLILSKPNSEVIEKGALKKSKIVFAETTSVFLKHLKAAGEWAKIDASIKEILYEQNDKKLIWDCHTPKAKFNIKIGEHLFQGFGYCETLTLPFFPWKLPIETLKWGRFLSEKICIIWIEWIGEHPLKKIYWNGELCSDAEIKNDRIIFVSKNTELVFEKINTIKNNPLSAIANRYWLLKNIFPKRFLKTQEVKYCAIGKIITDRVQRDKGQALYEIVKWKK